MCSPYETPAVLALAFWALCLGACDSPTDSAGPSHLEVLNSPGPLGVPGYALLDTLHIRSTDAAGQSRPGQLLSWIVQEGHGSLEILDSVTDESGEARAVWTLGAQAGPNRARVASAEDTVTFDAKGTAFRVDQLDSDYGMGCGLRAGDLWCWPWSGGAPPSSAGPPSIWATTFNAPALVAEGRHYIDLAVGASWVCALTTTQSTECYWNGASSGPVLPTLPPLRSLAGSGGGTICGLATADSTAWCWDMNNEPRVGAQVPGSPAFVTLSINHASQGIHHTSCGLLPDSTAACWGRAPVGDGTNTDRASPTPIAGGLTFAQVTAGYGYACGRRTNGEAWCWGKNESRTLGMAGPDALSPVLSATGISEIAAGHSTVGVVHFGQAARWGQFQFGDPLGNPLTPLPGFPTGSVASFSDNSEISCLLLQDGQVYCFHEIWVFTSTLDIDLYLAVQPVPDQADR